MGGLSTVGTVTHCAVYRHAEIVSFLNILKYNFEYIYTPKLYSYNFDSNLKFIL